MYSSAISIGYAVPSRDFDASVHSAFHSALNLRLNKENGLLTVIASSEGDLPQGIQVDLPDGFSFEGFQTGGQAVCRDGILRFENRSLTVQLSGARRWECDLPALKFDPTNPDVSAAWTQVWETLNRRQRQLGAEIVADDILRSSTSARTGISGRVNQAMRALLDTTRRYDLSQTSAVDALIGLGAGLTPSGDDLLVGYTTGLWCTAGDKTRRAQFISSLGKMIVHLSQNTTDISRTYLYHAAKGQVSSRLADLAEGICKGTNSKHLGDIAEAALSVGHTSGMDIVTGVLAGLAAWEGNSLVTKP